MLWEYEVGVCLDRECLKFVIAGGSKVKFYGFHNFELEQVITNFPCGDQQILIMVI